MDPTAPFPEQREYMVRTQIIGRGVTDARVLRAMRAVPREEFIPKNLRKHSYNDTPLPIAENQTISQPYIVAFMLELLELEPDDKVLEVGAGSGYAAAVLGHIVKQVYAIEWHARLAREAADRMERLGVDSVEVRQGDGSQGWPEHAPYDAILVSAGGWEIPASLRKQLAIGGRMVIPVGTAQTQSLRKIKRTGQDTYEEEDVGSVRFVPLVGEEGWASPRLSAAHADRIQPKGEARLISDACEPFESIETADLAPLLERIGDSKVVLLGEASHGTSEFYRMRARITRQLIEQLGFSIVAIEGDWPDCKKVDRYVRHLPQGSDTTRPFHRFPHWMWRNEETVGFIEWLRAHNMEEPDPSKRTTFAGLDVYSMYSSVEAVLNYLESQDPSLAQEARRRYGCLTPWEGDPATYGRTVLSGRFEGCEKEVLTVLRDLLERSLQAPDNSEELRDAVQNARVVASAEEYYREMYYDSAASWNLRDSHMFKTLKNLLDYRGSDARAVVWAHNSHVGDASVTDMAARGELNIGQLCREEFKSKAYHIGFGTYSGEVAAASSWGGTMEIMSVRPALEGSYEHLCHQAAHDNFLLHLRDPKIESLRDQLLQPRLERAIGVIYRPQSERLSHYFQAMLPEQFDEYIWFDKTTAVKALPAVETDGVPDTFPFGL